MSGWVLFLVFGFLFLFLLYSPPGFGGEGSTGKEVRPSGPRDGWMDRWMDGGDDQRAWGMRTRGCGEGEGERGKRKDGDLENLI